LIYKTPDGDRSQEKSNYTKQVGFSVPKSFCLKQAPTLPVDDHPSFPDTLPEAQLFNPLCSMHVRTRYHMIFGLSKAFIDSSSAISLLISDLQNDRLSFLKTGQILHHSDCNIQMLYVKFLDLRKR
jgi:hypothetical protein